MNNILIAVEDLDFLGIQLTKALALQPQHLHLLIVTEQARNDTEAVEAMTKEFVDSAVGAQVNFSLEAHDLATELDKASLITNLVDQRHVELVVLCRHRHVSEDDVVNEKSFLRELRAPMLIVTDLPWSEQPKILSTVDLKDDDLIHTKLNEKVVKVSDLLNGAIGGALHATSVIPISRIGEELDIVESAEVMTEQGDKVRAELQGYIAKTIAKDCELHVRAGSTAKALASVAQEIQPDIMVMGNVGRTGLEGFFVGNTVEKVMKLWQQDMLVLHI